MKTDREERGMQSGTQWLTHAEGSINVCSAGSCRGWAKGGEVWILGGCEVEVRESGVVRVAPSVTTRPRQQGPEVLKRSIGLLWASWVQAQLDVVELPGAEQEPRRAATPQNSPAGWKLGG